MTAAVAAGRVTPQRLAQSVRRVLEIKRRLGLFERRTVPLDSIPHVVGSKRFQDAANDIAVRSLTLVRDVGGRLHALRGHPGRLALIAYADEANRSGGPPCGPTSSPGAASGPRSGPSRSRCWAACRSAATSPLASRRITPSAGA